MTDYPAHIEAAAKALAEKHNWSLDCWGKSQIAALCEALTMETVPEPVDPLVEVFEEIGWSTSSPRGDRPTRLREALAKRGLHIAPSPAPVPREWFSAGEPFEAMPPHVMPVVSEERIKEMAREVCVESYLADGSPHIADIYRVTNMHNNSFLMKAALAGIKRGLAERGEGA